MTWRRRPRASASDAPDPGAAGGRELRDRLDPPLAVVVAPRLGGWAVALRGALDGHFAVSVGPPPTSGVAVVELVEPAAVAAVRQTAPQVGLIVVVEGRHHEPVPIADLFDAGADAVLTAPDVRMLAAHVRALARRFR